MGTYVVEGSCVDVQNSPSQTAATDFDYTDATFEITAAVTTTDHGGPDDDHHRPRRPRRRWRPPAPPAFTG